MSGKTMNNRCGWETIIAGAAFAALTLTFAGTGFSADNSITTTWRANGAEIYEEGFAHMVMRGTNDSVQLFDMDLVENDAPGAGQSEKGVHHDVIWGKVHARKILNVEDPRAKKAYLVVYNYRQGKTPLTLKINGNTTKLELWNTSSYYMNYIWGGFPAEWLRKGRNVIELSCPEAENEKDGWDLYLARGDEFEHGGGNPADVGKTSFKSTDGGETWKESPFGPLGNDRAEYSVRLSFDRFVPSGWLETPVVDMWRENPDDFAVLQHTVQKVTVSLSADVPEGTRIEYYLRKGTAPGPFSPKWEPYEFIGAGPSVTFEAGREFNRRYVQIRAMLSTGNPLYSPSVREMSVEAVLREPYPVAEYSNYILVEADNPPIRYSSIAWEWEAWDRPEFKELIERENLDELLEGCQSEFEAQVRLLDYATKRWNWTQPQPEYPEWDALSIVNRINKAGGGGMCIQHNNFLAGMCMAYGWQARLANVDGHEVCEVWNDDYGKWIYLDASYNHYLFDKETAEPLNVLELHKKYLDYFYPGESIDWADGKGNQFQRSNFDPEKEDAGVGRGSLSHYKRKTLGGLVNASFFRFVPRNNFYEKPYPRPVAHGNSLWPWNGYVNWYDDHTPRKRQYSWHTDRLRDLYPDLNTVHVHVTQGPGNERLYLQFESYTPSLSHFEVNTNDTGWRKTAADWTWMLRSGRNTLLVRAVTKAGVSGKPSRIVLNFADTESKGGL